MNSDPSKRPGPIPDVVWHMTVVTREFNTAVETGSVMGCRESVIIRPVRYDQHEFPCVYTSPKKTS